MTTASICTIGDEILIGQIVDTNSARISAILGDNGIRCTRILSIGDLHDEIIENIGEELRKNDIVITTGGLGPTKDDITKKALADLSGCTSFTENKEQLSIIHEILHARGLEVLDINRAQAMVPDTCEVIPNRLGTAPIMIFRFDENSGFGHRCTLYSLPGVPFEAMGAMDEVVADIRKHCALTDIYHKTLMTFGMAESALAKMISQWEDALPDDIHLAYLPNMSTGVRLRLSIYGGKKEEEERRISEEFEKLKPMLGDLVYSEEDDNLQNVLGKLLLEKGLTVSTAESCTGGNVAALITSIPGASAYFKGSVVSYATDIKTKVLGVPDEVVERHGVVSMECAEKMAEGVRLLTGSDYSVSTTGIAGPGGGTEENPAGTVWIGVSGPHGTYARKFVFSSDRKRNTERFSANALNMLRLCIINDK